MLMAALLGFAATVCLWRLYFVDAAPAAARALAEASPRGRHRQRLASDAYTLAHLPLVAGVLYFALGLRLVLASAMDRTGPGHAGGVPLEWLSTIVLYGGVALYLVGRFLFLRLTVSTSPAPLVATGMLLLLVPAARFLPAVAALGLLTTLLIGLVCYERLTWRVREA
ncbi:low temperature requirement protein A [Micromonospora sp. DT43]|uniref:low temperature requirement protein A n=1 Tax=Micromonospora sp. DT43 TaxID=3393440 RepID=UPI003CF539A7